MIARCTFVRARGTDPYANLALEEALVRCVQPGECILYLWQNANTVVIGRNQNCWKECRTDALARAGGHLARRLSGGGAVYHDLGNLNFTFLAQASDYDVQRQTDVILTAVRALGVPAQRTGRNDLTADGRKFSGNAYYRTKAGCYQHGTLLVDADFARMAQFLSVSPAKLQAKGVDSVPARVCNLRTLAPGLTVPALEEALRAAFSACYGLPCEPFDEARLAAGELETLRKKYASDAWRYGRTLPFTLSAERRFAWGEVQVQLAVRAGCIEACAVYTDALETEFPAWAERALTGCPFTGAAVRAALGAADEAGADTGSSGAGVPSAGEQAAGKQTADEPVTGEQTADEPAAAEVSAGVPSAGEQIAKRGRRNTDVPVSGAGSGSAGAGSFSTDGGSASPDTDGSPAVAGEPGCGASPAFAQMGRDLAALLLDAM